MKDPVRTVLALDFGGTKLAAGIVDVLTGQILASGRNDTPRDEGAEAVFEAMAYLARGLGPISSVDGIGVSFGGHVHNGQVLRSLHVSGWEHFPLAEQLKSAFDLSEIRIANDANAAALGEWRFGAGRGTESMLYVTVSTGIGGGLILNRTLHAGWRGLSGEIGHMKVVPGGPMCTCGRRGCLEAVSSGPAIARRARELLDSPDYAASCLRGARHLTAAEVASAAETGDALGRAVLREAAVYLGTAIANAVNLVDIECVVVGGGVSRAGEYWWETVREAVRSEVLSITPEVKLALSSLGGNETMLGAAALLDI